MSCETLSTGEAVRELRFPHIDSEQVLGFKHVPTSAALPGVEGEPFTTADCTARGIPRVQSLEFIRAFLGAASCSGGPMTPPAGPGLVPTAELCCGEPAPMMEQAYSAYGYPAAEEDTSTQATTLPASPFSPYACQLQPMQAAPGALPPALLAALAANASVASAAGPCMMIGRGSGSGLVPVGAHQMLGDTPMGSDVLSSSAMHGLALAPASPISVEGPQGLAFGVVPVSTGPDPAAAGVPVLMSAPVQGPMGSPSQNAAPTPAAQSSGAGKVPHRRSRGRRGAGGAAAAQPSASEQQEHALLAPQRLGSATGDQAHEAGEASEAHLEDAILDIDIPGAEHMTKQELRRARRMLSNRESARRSRKRKQEHLASLEAMAAGTTVQHEAMVAQIAKLSEDLAAREQELALLRAENATLRNASAAAASGRTGRGRA